MRVTDFKKMLYWYMYMYMLNTTLLKFYQNWAKMKSKDSTVFKFKLLYVIKTSQLGRELSETLAHGFTVSYQGPWPMALQTTFSDTTYILLCFQSPSSSS